MNCRYPLVAGLAILLVLLASTFSAQGTPPSVAQSPGIEQPSTEDANPNTPQGGSSGSDRLPRNSARGGWFAALDKNKDGLLVKEEVSATQMFERLDTNADAKITRAEALAAIRRARSGRASRAQALPLPPMPAMKTHRNIPYHTAEGVQQHLLSLDIYASADATKKSPVVVMVHGGGWQRGDKANRVVFEAKSRHFVAQGYVFVSVNYRLSPAVKHPVHVQDVARALAWIDDNIEKYGGERGPIYLMGHSAGAHLAALVATDDSYLKKLDKDLSILDGVVLLDTAAYDLPRFVDELGAGPQMEAMYQRAFGEDRRIWKQASPQTHVAGGKRIPPFLVFHAGGRLSGAILSQALTNALNEAGSPAQAVYAADKDHGAINADIGRLGDWVTELVMRFFQDPQKVSQLKPAGAQGGANRAGPARAGPNRAGPNRAWSVFQRLDVDSDGRVTEAEFAKWSRGQQRPGLLQKLDRNGDGAISLEETQPTIQELGLEEKSTPCF